MKRGASVNDPEIFNLLLQNQTDERIDRLTPEEPTPIRLMPFSISRGALIQLAHNIESAI